MSSQEMINFRFERIEQRLHEAEQHINEALRLLVDLDKQLNPPEVDIDVPPAGMDEYGSLD